MTYVLLTFAALAITAGGLHLFSMARWVDHRRARWGLWCLAVAVLILMLAGGGM